MRGKMSLSLEGDTSAARAIIASDNGSQYRSRMKDRALFAADKCRGLLAEAMSQ